MSPTAPPAGLTLTWDEGHRLHAVPEPAGERPVTEASIALAGLVNALGSIYGLAAVIDELDAAAGETTLTGERYQLAVAGDEVVLTGVGAEVRYSREVLAVHLRGVLAWAEASDPAPTPLGVS